MSDQNPVPESPVTQFLGASPDSRESVAHNIADAPTVGPFPEAGPESMPAELAQHPRYRVLQLLGTGGMGSVYKAEHRKMERLVALKMLNPEFLRDELSLQRFLQEVKTAAKLVHPNIVTAYDADEAGSVHFLVMEYVDGVSLAEIVLKRGSMAFSRACECVRQAALGLQHAFEKGMVHRDIKPQNLMLSMQGRLKILDFGLARFAMETAGVNPTSQQTTHGAHQEGLTLASTLMGTPDYMAPEQAADAHKADIRADIYSLGCTLYHLLTAQAPFPGGTIIEKVVAHLEETPRPLTDFRRDVPAELSKILNKMMAKDPAQRYQAPVDVARALAPFVKSAPVPGKETVAPPPRSPSPADSERTRSAKALQPVASASMEKELIAIANEERPRTRPTKPLRTSRKRRTPWYAKKPVLLGSGAILTFLTVFGIVLLARNTAPSPSTTLPAAKATLTLQADGIDAAVLIIQDGNTVGRLEPHAAPSFEVESGRYHLLLEGSPEGLVLSRDTATLLPGDEAIVKVLRKPAPEPDVTKIVQEPAPTSAPSLLPVELRRFEGHKSRVSGVTFGGDEGRVLTWSADKTLKLFDAATGKCVRTYEGHTDYVTAAVACPDGKHFLSCSFDGTVRFWDYQNPKPLATLPGPSLGRLRCLAISPDGALIAAAGEGQNQRIMIWNSQNLLPLGTLTGHTGSVTKIEFSSPNGRYLYSASWDNTLGVWEVPLLKRTKKLDHTEPVQALAVSRDGKFLLSATRSGVMRLWSTTSGEEVHRSQPLGYIVDGFSFSPTGQYALVVGGGSGDPIHWVPGDQGMLRCWDVRDWKEVWRHDLASGPLFGVALSEDGRSALTSHWDHVARLWKIPDPDKAASPASPTQLANGVLTIESEDANASVVLKRDNKIVEGPTTSRTITLSPGAYQLDWSKPQPLLEFSSSNFELLSGGQKTIRIRRVHLTWPGKQAAPDLSKLKPLFEDGFSNPKSGFRTKKESGKNLSVALAYGHDSYSIDVHTRTPVAVPFIFHVPIPFTTTKNFACQVIGRVSGSAASDWGLGFGVEKQKRGMEIALGSKGTMAIWPTEFQLDTKHNPLMGLLQNPALHTGLQFNTLLIVVKDGLLEVYVNSVAVCDPINLEGDYTPANLFLSTEGPGPLLHSEFQRVTVWAGAKIPTALARGATRR